MFIAKGMHIHPALPELILATLQNLKEPGWAKKQAKTWSGYERSGEEDFEVVLFSKVIPIISFIVPFYWSKVIKNKKWEYAINNKILLSKLPSTMLLVAFRAINRSAAIWFKGNLCLFSAIRTNYGVHFSWLPVKPAPPISIHFFHLFFADSPSRESCSK